MITLRGQDQQDERSLMTEPIYRLLHTRQHAALLMEMVDEEMGNRNPFADSGWH